VCTTVVFISISFTVATYFRRSIRPFAGSVCKVQIKCTSIQLRIDTAREEYFIYAKDFNMKQLLCLRCMGKLCDATVSCI
jgi:hypothetical protein